tara:strand:- start:2390 stop:3187 length:798 start_codon:yes stop_codon:yes gene_type:complete
MPLGLGAQMGKGGIVKSIPSHVTSNLKMLHRYNTGSVVPVSDGAAYFDGTDDYITMGDITGADGASALTLACWVNLKDSAIDPLISKGAYNTAGDSFAWMYDVGTGSGRMSFSIANSITAYKDSLNDNAHAWSTTTDTGSWAHLAVTYNKSAENITFYINGVAFAPSSGPTGSWVDIPDTSEELYLGRIGSNYANYYMCNAAIWTTALTQAQIKSIMFKNYAGLIDSEKTNLVSWWNLDVQTATDGTAGSGGVKDSHGSNHGDLE